MNLETPVHGASEIGHVKVGDKLMEYGADSSKIDESRKTPLLAVSKSKRIFQEFEKLDIKDIETIHRIHEEF